MLKQQNTTHGYYHSKVYQKYIENILTFRVYIDLLRGDCDPLECIFSHQVLEGQLQSVRAV